MSAILRQQLARSLILENIKDKLAKLNRRKRQSKPYVNVTVSCPTFRFHHWPRQVHQFGASEMSALRIESYGMNHPVRGLASALLSMRRADVEELAVWIDAVRRNMRGKSDAALKGRHLIEAAQQITGMRFPLAAPGISGAREEPL